MEKEYVRIEWKNRPSIATPLGQSNLNKMDYQIDKNENTLITFDTTKANQSDLLQTIRTLTYDTETGIFVFTFWNGSTYTVDLNIEKIPVSFSMDEYGVITMTTADGTTYTCDIGALIKLYTFVDGDEIDFVTTTDAGGNKTITASIKDGSIVGSKLQPNFLADCQAAKAQAELAATSASSDASDAELSSEDSEAWAVGERNGQPVPSTDPAYENNAKWWAQHGTGSSFAGLTDTNFTNLQGGQIAKYDDVTQKWINTEDEGGLLPHFKITSEAGSTVTVVCPDTSVIVPTQTSSGIWQCDVPAYGVYTVHAVINGDDAVRTVTVDTVKEYVIHDEHYSYTLNVYAPTGSSILVTDGGDETYTGTGAGSTAVIFALHQASTTYTIEVTYDGLERDTTITSSATSGGSGSKTIEFGTINLTLDEDLIGETIVMTNGTATKSKVADSTSMVFYPNATGNWTISCEYDGETYYSEPNPVVVSSLSTPVSAEISLVHIPEGATVTPTDDIQTWLACANITDKSYTTLAEVLADRETFETLIADSNACDYMARSTTWAGDPTVKVPTMTSYTAPSGVVGYSSVYSGFPWWWAFDGNISAEHDGMISGTSGYVSYQFTKSVKVNKVSFYNRTGVGGIKDFTVDYYDGSNWQTVYTGTATQESSKIKQTFSFDNDVDSTTWRINILNGHGATNAIGFNGCQFTYEGITTSQDAMSLIGKYDYCSNALLGNAAWAEAIANSDYFEEVLNVKVPVMTSATTPSGVVYTSSNLNSDRAGYKAFDNNSSTSWHSLAGVPQSIAYEFTEPVNVRFVKLLTTSGGSGPKVSKIQYSLDGNTYNDYSDDANFVDCTVASTWYSKIYFSDIQAKYFRLNIAESNYSSGGSPYVVFSELQFYGRASSEVFVPLVPTMTSNTTPSGEVKSNVAAYSGNPYQVFDGNDNTSVYWTQTDNPYVEYDFASGHSYIVKRFMIYPYYNSQYGLYAKDYKIEASNDGATWTTLYTGTFTNSNVGKVYIDIENNTAYSKYRLYFTSETYANGKNWQIYELQFYAKTVQTNIIHSAPNDTIYMMENGTQVPVCTTNSDGDGIFDFSELEEGVYTFGSTVAKNPNDLTEDFKKRIRITKTPYGGTTERYLLPDTIRTSYWWGLKENEWSTLQGSASSKSLAWNTTSGEITCGNSTAYSYETKARSMKQGDKLKSCFSTTLTSGTVQSTMMASTVASDPFNNNVGRIMKTGASAMTVESANISANANVYVNFGMSNNTSSSGKVTLYGLWYESSIKATPTFISAANDTLYIMDGNTKVYVANTDGSGKSYEPMLLPGTYTIYSSVAKDPNNLSNSYSKTVTITEATQTVAIMPENTLYWYGNTCDGWTNDGYGYSGMNSGDLTFNTTNILMNIITTASQTIAISGITNAVDITDYDVLKVIAYKNNDTLISNLDIDIQSLSGNNYIGLYAQRYSGNYWDNAVCVGSSKNFSSGNIIWSRDIDSNLNSYHTNPAYVYAVLLE